VRRREFMAGVGAVACARPPASFAQQAAKIARIGFLVSGSVHSSPARRTREAVRQGLRDFGYVEGQNITIEYRSADGNFDRLPELAAELIRLDVEVIIATPSPAAVAAKNATAAIPIVMINVGDPVGLGLVASLGHPGANVTGLSFGVGMDTFGKALELLKDAVPDLHRVAILWNPTNPAHALALEALKVAAQKVGAELELVSARARDEFQSAFATVANARARALMVVSDAMFSIHAEPLAELALKYKLPSMHGLREEVEAGGLMSYGPNSADHWRRAATFVDKILKGARPADLPVQQPTNFELVINLRTARALGLTIPPTLLARADEVIE
jgi:putative tryptophan/tyrosine transport system substrate-binding protein